MLIGNVILVILNLPLVSLFVSILRTPVGYLAPLVLIICIVGVYSVKGSAFDLGVMALAGAGGYFLRLYGYDMSPLLLAFVLGDRIEVSFRRALMISEGDPVIFLQGPAAQTFLFLLVAALAIIAGGAFWRSRKKSAG